MPEFTAVKVTRLNRSGRLETTLLALCGHAVTQVTKGNVARFTVAAIDTRTGRFVAKSASLDALQCNPTFNRRNARGGVVVVGVGATPVARGFRVGDEVPEAVFTAAGAAGVAQGAAKVASAPSTAGPSVEKLEGLLVGARSRVVEAEEFLVRLVGLANGTEDRSGLADSELAALPTALEVGQRHVERAKASVAELEGLLAAARR